MISNIHTIFTAPGTETNIAITATHHTRQSKPYKTNCTSTYPPTKGVFNVESTKYSTKICKQTCMIEFIHKICGCIDPLLVEASFDLNFQNTTFCRIEKSNTERRCAENATMEFGVHGLKTCHCQSECDSLDYKVQNKVMNPSFGLVKRCFASCSSP